MNKLNDIAYSNDKLEIVNINNNYFVKKTFFSGLARAKKSVQKQIEFNNKCAKRFRISAANVEKFTIKSDCAELLMPYIQGMSGHTLTIHATREIGIILSNSISELLLSEMDSSRDEVLETSIFTEKLGCVKSLINDVELRSLLLDAGEFIKKLPRAMKFPVGYCHGDLTLNNMIIDNSNKIFLIDFLDTYLDSPLQDVAKLKQDFVYGWSFRKDQLALKTKGSIFCNYFYPETAVNIENTYPTQVHLMTLLALVRIAPYVRDSTTKDWLILSIKKCLDE